MYRSKTDIIVPESKEILFQDYLLYRVGKSIFILMESIEEIF